MKEIDEQQFLKELHEQHELMKEMGLPCNFKSSKKKARNQKKKNQCLKGANKKIFDNLKKLEFVDRAPLMFDKWYEIEEKGIKIDNEMFYGITPEKFASAIASYCKEKVDYTILLDGFCGVGGNLIQFARENKNAFIIGIDLIPERVENAKKIAEIYGVEDRCDFICGNFVRIAPNLRIKPDIVFLSPPWGGPSYARKSSFLLSDLVGNGYNDGKEIFEVSKKLTNNIVFFLPKTQSKKDLRNRLDQDFSWCLNVDNDGIFGRTLNVYFGDLIDKTESQNYVSKNSLIFKDPSTPVNDLSPSLTKSSPLFLPNNSPHRLMTNDSNNNLNELSDVNHNQISELIHVNYQNKCIIM